MVELLPGMPAEPIRIVLHHGTLSGVPKCSAVSYEWGSKIREHDIFCDGRVLKVTANLSLLLSKLRTPDSSQLLWIDAICINQDDLDERSQQVLLMGDIYKNATMVLMWVGDQNVHTRDAIPVIRRFAELSHALKLKPGMSVDGFLPYEDSQDLDSSTKEWIQDVRRKASWAGVADLLSSRTYFTRLWIIQEIALSSKATVICGDHRIEWKSLYEAAMFVRAVDIEGLHNYTILLNIALLGQMCFKSLKLTYSNILHSFPFAQVTNERDYVYGYLGIFEKESIDLKISVDYSSTVEKVFQDATENIFVQKQDLLIFRWESVEYYSRPRSSMPSWARNFGFHLARFVRNYSPEVEMKLNGTQRLTVEGDYLTARGLIIDSIEQVSDNFHQGNIKQIVVDAFNSHLSVLSGEAHVNVAEAAQKTFQSLYSPLIRDLPRQSFFGLLSSWLIEAFGSTPAVPKQNSKVGKLAKMKNMLGKWLSHESKKDKITMDLVRKNSVLQWSSEQHSSVEDQERCYFLLTFHLFSREPALGVNMFKGTKGFAGIGPAGRNTSPANLPAVQVGDHIALFPTAGNPMIIRDRGDGSYTLIGTAHVGNILEIPWCEGETAELVPLRIR